MKIAYLNRMKKFLLYISLTVILIIFNSFFICKEENKSITEMRDTMINLNQEKNLEKIDSNSTTSLPDYVPPKRGGNNKNWYYYRNRKLMTDSNCCFGRGMRNRYRHRWGWQRNQ
ncbi:MAG: hypothetical protein N2490_09225 [Ignavibacteria bacterium]|nr:hypothetical protein [Ignavibacteria bacterium]